MEESKESEDSKIRNIKMILKYSKQSKKKSEAKQHYMLLAQTDKVSIVKRTRTKVSKLKAYRKA